MYADADFHYKPDMPQWKIDQLAVKYYNRQMELIVKLEQKYGSEEIAARQRTCVEVVQCVADGVEPPAPPVRTNRSLSVESASAGSGMWV